MELAIENKFSVARKNMVDCQIRPSKVTDEKVLSSFENMPREYFLPTYLQGIAYVDEDIDLGKGHFLMEPVILARLLQAAKIKDTDIVLDIGCSTGYSTAILSSLASTVIGIDDDADFVAQADELLQNMDICNVALIHSAVREGYEAQAPFDVIVVNGAVPRVPGHILDQLADGGRLVTVVCEKGKTVGTAVLMTKEKGLVTTKNLFDAATHFVAGFDEHEFFKF